MTDFSKLVTSLRQNQSKSSSNLEKEDGKQYQCKQNSNLLSLQTRENKQKTPWDQFNPNWLKSNGYSSIK